MVSLAPIVCRPQAACKFHERRDGVLFAVVAAGRSSGPVVYMLREQIKGRGGGVESERPGCEAQHFHYPHDDNMLYLTLDFPLCKAKIIVLTVQGYHES